MASLRPMSVCDTTPLQRLESQSSSSEPSSPTLHNIGNSTSGQLANSNDHGNALVTPSAMTTAPTTADTTPTNGHLHRGNNTNHNNNIEVRLNNFINLNKRDSKHERGVKLILLRILFDVVILACVCIPIWGYNRWDGMRKIQYRGFFCDDESLKYPYRPSTIKSWMMSIMCFLLPVACIVTIEFFKSNNKKMRGFGILSTPTNYHIYHLPVPDWLIESYKSIGLLIFGTALAQLTTEVAKHWIARKRPHFFEICNVILDDGTTCNDPINQGRFVENYVCNPLFVNDGDEIHLSFPSGHATIAFYTMVYMAIFLQQRLGNGRFKLLKHLLQFLFLMFAWFVSLTRISDYMHHWTDVLGGAVIGTLYAVMVSFSKS